jgi:phosphoribosylformylglycinamidine synthase PurS subunit
VKLRNSPKLLRLNSKKNKLKFAVTVTLKKDVLDPQGKVVQQTLKNMGMMTLQNLRQGKYFEIDIKDDNEENAKSKVDEMCKKLLVNLIIEDFTISKI